MACSWLDAAATPLTVLDETIVPAADGRLREGQLAVLSGFGAGLAGVAVEAGAALAVQRESVERVRARDSRARDEAQRRRVSAMQDTIQELSHLLSELLQVRLFFKEIMEVVCPPLRVPCPSAAVEHGLPVIRRAAIGRGIAPDIPVPLRRDAGLCGDRARTDILP